MSYWGKVSNTFSNFTGANTEQLQAQLKSRDKLLKELGSDLTKLKEENQYMNKAFEQLEEINRSSEEKLQSITALSKQCTQSIMQTIKTSKQSLVSDICRQFSEQLEDLLGEPFEDQNLIINLQGDCTKSLEKGFRSVFDKCIESIDKNKQVEEIKASFIEKQQHLNAKIQQQRQQSEIVINQLKSMHSTQKQNVAKLQGELKSIKISQQKSQKQVFMKCEENNALAQKNKTLNSQIAEKDQQIQKLAKHIEQLDSNQTSFDKSKLINTITLIKAEIQDIKEQSMSIRQHLADFKLIPDQIITSFIQNIQQILPAKTLQFTEDMQQYLGGQIWEKMGQFCKRLNQERMNELMNQIDRLNESLQSIKYKCRNKLEKTKEQSQQILAAYQQAQKRKTHELNQEIQVLEWKIDQLSTVIANKQSRINDLEASLKQAEHSQQIQISLQKQTDILKQENQSIRDKLIQVQEEHSGVIQQKQNQIRDCMAELEEYKRESGQLNTLIKEYQQKTQQIKQQPHPCISDQYQLETIKLKQQIIKLQKENDQMRKYQMEVETVKHNKQIERQQQEQRNSCIQQKQSEISKLTELSKKLMEDLTKARHSHQTQLLNHQEIIQQQKDQIAMRQKQYQQRIHDLTHKTSQQLKKIEQQSLTVQQLQKNKTQLSLELQNLKSQSHIENNSEIQQLQRTLGQYKNTVDRLKEQNKQLIGWLKTKEHELQEEICKQEELKAEIQKLRNEDCEQVRAARQEKDRIESKFNSIMVEKQEIQKQRSKDIEQLDKIKGQLTTQIEKLQSELEINNHKIQSEKQQLQSQMNNTIINQQNIINDLTNTNQQIKQQLQNTKINLLNTQSQNNQLTHQVQELKNDIEMMDHISKQMDEQYIKLEAASKTTAQYKALKQLFMDKWGKQLISSNLQQIHAQFMSKAKQYQEAIIELNQTKQRLEQSQKVKGQLKQELQNIESHLRQQLEAIMKDNRQLKQQISEKDSQMEKLEHSIATKQTTEESLSKQIQFLSGKMGSVEKQKEQAIENIRAEKKQAEDNLKKQLQNMKNKYQKMERTVSQAAIGNNELKQKVKTQENKMIDMKKQQQELEEKIKQRQEKLQSGAEEIRNLQKQLEKMIIDSTERVKKERQNGKKELGDLEEMFKSQKSNILKKHTAELEKLKQQISQQEKKLIQKENQLKEMKAKVNEEKKAGAMLTAKMEEMKQQVTKIQSIQNSNNSIKSKLLQKQEELRKAFQNMQNLKSTITQLETGIETYHGFVEQKSQEISELQQQFDKLKLLYDGICKENQSLKERMEQQGHLFKALNNESSIQVEPHAANSDKKQMILPIKRLFLKYFEEAATYQQKINTLNTLCEVLGLDKKQQEIIKSYKKYKLANIEIAPKEKEQKAPEGIQNKFFEFLTAD